ncbi:MAG: hypothetical protein JJE17_01760 [Peptostreptococcaceae bacterium]|nr:hypothetical protein [Peptostreptococcaceae bacterium]
MIKDELKQIYYINNEIVMWQTELLKMHQDPSAQKRAKDPMDPYAATELIIIKQLKKIQNQQKRTMDYIQKIEDSFIRQIIICRYLSLMAWEQVAQNIGGMNSGDGMRNMCNRFLKAHTN